MENDNHFPILENYYLLNTDRDIINKIIMCPPYSVPHKILALYKDCVINLSLSSGSNSCQIRIVDSMTEITEQEYSSQIVINIDVFKNGNNPHISHLSMLFFPMLAEPINVNHIKIINKARYGISVGLDFGHAILMAKGLENCISKEVQIKSVEGKIYNISSSSHNFQWDSDILYCILPISSQFWVRFRFKTENKWVDWSAWMPFTCKRKMTL